MTRLVLLVGSLGMVVGLAGLPSCSQTSCDVECSVETIAGSGGGAIAGSGGQAGTPIDSTCGGLRSTEKLPSGACTYALGPLPGNENWTSYDNITIFVDGQALPRDISHSAGWDYADATHASITIYGQVCADLTNGLIQTVTVAFVCIDV
jgi:hypothetical protein